MRKRGTQVDAGKPSSLENRYREFFQQTTLDDTVPFINDEFMSPQPRDLQLIIRTYTTYGAYEEPVGKY